MRHSSPSRRIGICFGPQGSRLSGVVGLGSSSPSSNAAVLALMQFWWDTTNTFHMPWGEITVTPHDFTMITGLPFGGRRIVLGARVDPGNEIVRGLLGPIADILYTPPRCEGTVSLGSAYRGLLCPGASAVQRMRLWCLIVLGHLTLADRSSRIPLRYLPLLEDLYAVSEFDWGGLAYGHLLHQMRLCCRGGATIEVVSISGLWRALEVSCLNYDPSFLVLFMLCPLTICFCSAGCLSTFPP